MSWTEPWCPYDRPPGHARPQGSRHGRDVSTWTGPERNWLGGPVVRDVRTGSGLYYVLVAPDAQWEGPEDRLRTGIHLAVPRLGRQVSPVTYWAVEPQRRGQLCDPAHLAALLSTADTLKAAES
ncbi:hypothetical protein [Streptomyces flavofungini]|uniref:hypothetical protein n=1 Tax=Streptomyces flavofungini TaxID=68200 RepID=UPI0025B18EFF|nr:hypothetical protein [Streptomyces flavofungini]WJV47385.1 hypothetical protein QUY26_18775 [Streptomyces flavofungini]